MAMPSLTIPNRIDAMFGRLRAEGRKAFVTYTVAADPTFDASLALLHEFVAAGIDLIELGYPFSDPILDGATIQKANRRALAAGGNLQRTLDLCKAFRQHDGTTPVVLMGYANPLAVMGYERFAERAADAGVDGIIAGDFPIREAAPLLAALHRHGLVMIPLAAPSLSPADYAVDKPGIGGFLYCIPVVGPTGGPSASTDAIAEAVERCRQHSRLPVMVGFGVKTPDMAAGVASVADGVIVATALIDQFDRLRASELRGTAFDDAVRANVQAFRQAIDRPWRGA